MLKSLVLVVFVFVSLATTVAHANTPIDALKREIQTYRKQEKLAPWINAHKTIAKQYLALLEYKKAISIIDEMERTSWRRPSTQEEKIAWCWAITNRGYIKSEGGDYFGAKEDYLNVLIDFEAFNYLDFNVINHVYHPLGNIYTRLGENEQAIRLLTKFIEANVAVNNKHYIGLGYNDLGLAFANKGDFISALDCYNKGLQLSGESNEAKGLLASNAAAASLSIQEYDTGIQFAMSSLAYFSRLKGDYRIMGYQAGAYVSLGMILTEKGDFVGAQRNFMLAEDKLTVCLPERQHRTWGKLYLARGENLLKQGSPSEALAHYQLALKSVIVRFNPASDHELPKMSQLYPEVVILEALLKKAEAYRVFSEKGKVKDHLEHSYRHYECYFLVEGLYRRECTNLDSKLSFIRELHDTGEEALQVITSLHALSKDESWLLKGVLLTEKTKGILLSESNFDSVLKDRQSLPKEIQELIRNRSYSESIRAQLSKAGLNSEVPSVKFLKEQDFQLSQELLLLTEIVKKKYPVIYRNMATTNSFDERDFERFISKFPVNTITYYFGSQDVYCFGIIKGKIHLHIEPVSETLSSRLSILRTQLATPDYGAFTSYKRAAVGCYSSFLKPFETHLSQRELLIIPDGPLALLPFEAFAKGKGTNFKKLDYLVRNYEIRYAYSMKRLMKPHHQNQFKENFLGTAPLFKNSSEYAELPYSENEINAGLKLGGISLLGKDATKKKFIENAAYYRILHLSTHATTWDERFHQASIAFSGKDAINERHLLTSELATLNCAPELIVLSACETGTGDYMKGEGVMSLSKSFAQTGSRNIMGSLWKVNHAANSEILSDFYKKLPLNNPSGALTLAKRQYLSNENVDEFSAHPHYWSSMVLVGSNQLSLNAQVSWGNWWIFGGSIVGLFALIGIIKLKRKTQLSK